MPSWRPLHHGTTCTAGPLRSRLDNSLALQTARVPVGFAGRIRSSRIRADLTGLSLRSLDGMANEADKVSKVLDSGAQIIDAIRRVREELKSIGPDTVMLYYVKHDHSPAQEIPYFTVTVRRSLLDQKNPARLEAFVRASLASLARPDVSTSLWWSLHAPPSFGQRGVLPSYPPNMPGTEDTFEAIVMAAHAWVLEEDAPSSAVVSSDGVESSSDSGKLAASDSGATETSSSRRSAM